ncbi:MAG: hypothetical protein R2698_11455 [Microthrixaceae bacterium]
MLIDALAFSPVRTAVVPAAVPDPVGDELRAAAEKVAARLPRIAEMLGVPSSSRRRRAPKPGSTDEAPTPSSGE